MKRLLLFTAAVLVATDLLAGHTYHFKVVMRSAWSDATITGLASVDGRKVRIDFEQGDDFHFPDAGVLLSTDGDNFQVFDMADGTFYDVKLGVLLNPASGMTTLPDGTTIDLAYTNPKVDLRDLGEGVKIAGFRTRKYTVRMSYDMHATVMGQPFGKNHFDITSEVWATDQLPAGLATFLQLQGLRTGIGDLDRLIDAHPMRIKGFPLRHVVKHTGTYGQGRSRSWTMESTVTAIRKGPIAASRFQPPPGFRRVDRPDPMRQTP